MSRNLQFAVVCWIVFVIFWAVSAFAVKPTKHRQRLPRRMFYLSLAAVAVALLVGNSRRFGFHTRVLPGGAALGLFGDMVVLAGLVLTLRARVALGRNWSGWVTLKQDHELIQSGPYRYVRHPIYSGLLVMVLGTAIIIGTLGGFFALLVYFLALLLKLRQEEELLSTHFPDSYPQYKARTKALIPFVF